MKTETNIMLISTFFNLQPFAKKMDETNNSETCFYVKCQDLSVKYLLKLLPITLEIWCKIRITTSTQCSNL